MSSEQKVEFREFKYLPMISGFLISMLLLSNVISNAKFLSLFFIPGLEWLPLSASVITYPFVFLGADILTEVYGYNRARRIIWAGFVVFLVSTVLVTIVQIFPPDSSWKNQKYFDEVFGAVPRTLCASFAAYILGEFSNSYILAKLKIRMSKAFENPDSFGAMSSRFVLSTFIAQFIDSVIFFPGALWGNLPNEKVIGLVFTCWIFKTLWEAIFVFVSVPIVKWLKRVENIDYLDKDTNFYIWHNE